MDLVRDNAFWQFSLRVYAEPGVASECLALQDAFDLDVNVLLFSAWLGAARQIALTADEIDGIKRRAGPWNGEVVKPLRQVRRYLKASGYERSEFRDKAKALELEAEQLEQAMLFDWSNQHGSRAASGGRADVLRANVHLCLSAYGCPADRAPEPLIDAALRVS